VRPRTATEKAFLALGPVAESFLRAAAAAGQTRLPAHLGDIVGLEAAHGRDRLVAALERALTFRRFTADDVRAILAAGPHAPTLAAPGAPLATSLPNVPARHLDAYAIDRLDAGHRVRYFTAAELVETLYRGLADNSVGRVIDTLLRNDLVLVDEVGFAPLDDTGAQLLFRFVAAAYERRSLGIGSHWPFDDWGRFLPEHTTAVSMLDRLLHHAHVVITDGDSYRMRTRGGGPNT
jgi:hypothetical protein